MDGSSRELQISVICAIISIGFFLGACEVFYPCGHCLFLLFVPIIILQVLIVITRRFNITQDKHLLLGIGTLEFTWVEDLK